MNPERIREILQKIEDGTLDVDEATDQLRSLPFEDLGFANVDHHRALRRGFPEVVLCQGKTKEQIVRISESILEAGSVLLATRADQEAGEAVRKAIPYARYNPVGRTIIARPKGSQELQEDGKGTILIITAGTSDIPVAEEASDTAQVMGNRVETLFDVGVAGIHRLLERRELIHSAAVIIVVAGMEGALASVVGGLVDVPVIGVPTSVGYGASFAGLAALLGMLTSCASGVTVVGIDNGFGAGYAASLINRVRED